MGNIERDDEQTAREWVERLIGRTWQTTAIVGALEEAERQADESRRQLKGAVDRIAELEAFVRAARPLLGLPVQGSLGARADALLANRIGGR